MGKKKLQSKKRIKELGGASPDRADAFVLAFYSYQPKLGGVVPLEKPDIEPTYTLEQLAKLFRRNPNILSIQPQTRSTEGRPTNLIL